MNIAILIVLYNVHPRDSQTLVTLSTIPFESGSLIVWNNGPDEVSFSDIEFINNGLCVHLINTLNNPPLSKIYNQFIKENLAEKYIILDHDSQINATYIDEALEAKSYLALPKVISHGKLCSPGKIPAQGQKYKKNTKISAITSGMVIKHDLITLVKAKYNNLFDENFALYGIDTTFMLRLKNLKLMEHVSVISGFEHSLSRDEKENDNMRKFRDKEMAICISLILRHYPSFSSLKRVIRRMIQSIQGKNQYPVKIMLSTILKGKHPRVISTLNERN